MNYMDIFPGQQCAQAGLQVDRRSPLPRWISRLRGMTAVGVAAMPAPEASTCGEHEWMDAGAAG